MRRRYLALAPLTIVVALAGTSVTGRAQRDPASRAIQYLVSQQRPDGSIDGAPGETEDFVLGAAAAGYDPSTLRATSGASPYAFLATHFAAAAAANAGDADAGHTAKLILAATAGRLTPFSFGGTNLVARLASLRSPAGVYGKGDTFTQSLGILAMRASASDAQAAPLARLLATENADGSWNTGTDAGAQGDTNSTSIALQALDAAGDHSHDGAVLAHLRHLENADGGFPYQNPSQFGTGSDPSSTALVIEAIAGAHQSPLDPAWTIGSSNPLKYLITTQQPSSGGLVFPGSPGPDTFTTSTAAQAMQLQALPVVTNLAPGSGIARQTLAGVRTLQFLVARQSLNGSFADDVGATSDVVMGLAAAGFDPSTLRTAAGTTALSYLAATVPSGNVAKTAKLALAVHASGLDPTGFGGHDLISEIAAAYDPSTGAYGPGATFGQALAVLATFAVGSPVPPAAIAHIEALQDSDGGWNYTNAPDGGPASDTNSTAIALMALATAGERPATGRGLVYLHRAQSAADGGFGYDTVSPSDPDSDALVLEALMACHENPVSMSWTRAGGTVTGSLLGLQDPTSGGYAFGSALPDVFTTSQVPAGLERTPLPIAPVFTPGAALPKGPVVVPIAPPGPTDGPAPSTAAIAGVSASGGIAVARSTRHLGTAPPLAIVVPAAGPVAAGEPTSTPSPSPSPSPSRSVTGDVKGAASGEPAITAPTPAGTESGWPWWVYALVALAGLAIVAGATWAASAVGKRT